MTDRSDIGDSLKDRTDSEIIAWVESMGGVEPFLEQTFELMRQAFHAERAEGQEALIQWNIQTQGGVFSHLIDVEDGHCSHRAGSSTDARVTMVIALPDFLRLITGILDGAEAAGSGRLQLGGDAAFAQTLSCWFEAAN